MCVYVVECVCECVRVYACVCDVRACVRSFVHGCMCASVSECACLCTFVCAHICASMSECAFVSVFFGRVCV